VRIGLANAVLVKFAKDFIERFKGRPDGFGSVWVATNSLDIRCGSSKATHDRGSLTHD
jgi:hypothetical protein